ncbi:MAG: hypothetical protein MRY78_00755 [Saprospiraceae bacterium]|nr:hypothetical protein [Saprospiraceae bacterium]
MKAIIFSICLVFSFGCNTSKANLSNCDLKPNFNEWKSQCLEQFNDAFSVDEGKEQGMIIQYVRKEIERIDIEKIEQSFCKLNTQRTEKFIFLHHYIEGESNFSVQSFIFHNDKSCLIHINNPELDGLKTVNDCNISLDDFESNYANNGLLIIATFDNQFSLTENKMYYGLSFSQIMDLAVLYK